MATREQMIAAIEGDRRALQGETTASLTAQFAAITHEPKAPKVTKSEAPKSIKASIDRGKMIAAIVEDTTTHCPIVRTDDDKREQRSCLQGFTNENLKACYEALSTTDEPKAVTVSVKPIMDEWTASVSDEVTMQVMLENIRLAFLEGRSHYGNELITAAKEAC